MATFGKVSSVMLSQARIIDIKRFSQNIGLCTEKDFKQIKKLMRDMYLS